MKIVKVVLTCLLGVLLIYGGINHFLKSPMYEPFVPDFLPKNPVIYLSGVLEIILGIGTFIPIYRHKASFGIFILMILFLPLHVWDVFSDTPAIGSHKVAIIRLPVQFLLIAWAWWASLKPKNNL